ncbi:MAG: sensor domain-containing diguanylate cyclase [Nocardioidaceae bacterium]|nr:sensor domain-containing diguanylate cyclase [Nocardioidaceae bacterium]
MDHESINRAIARLSAAAIGDLPSTAALQELCETAHATLDVDSAGVMLTDATGNRFVHATTPDAAELEALQEKLQSGPCRDAADTGRTVVATTPEEFAAWPEFGSGADTAAVSAMVAVPLMARGRCWGVLDLYRRAGPAWAADELDAVRLLGDVAAAYLAMGADRDAARLAQAQLVHQGNHDQLTGLVNRGLLLDRLDHALDSAPRRGCVVGVLFLDLDRFKAVNDTHGHLSGDLVLQAVAARLRETTRSADTVARLAGDEFVVVCDDLDPAAPLGPSRVMEVLAERIHLALANPVALVDGETTVPASIGAAVATGGTTARELLAAADAAMYRVKRGTTPPG